MNKIPYSSRLSKKAKKEFFLAFTEVLNLNYRDLKKLCSKYNQGALRYRYESSPYSSGVRFAVYYRQSKGECREKKFLLPVRL